MKWLWITLGAIVGTLAAWYIYVFFISMIFPVSSDASFTMMTVWFSTTVTVICTAIIVNQLKKPNKEDSKSTSKVE